MKKTYSLRHIFYFLENVCKVNFQKNPIPKPLLFTYYITYDCNFNCSYCHYSISGQTKASHKQLDTEEAIRLLKIIRREIPAVYFTGGEPLLRNDIVEILKTCRDLKFTSVSLNTNMSLIHRKMEVLDYVSNLVASLDALDTGESAKLIGMPLSIAQQVKENIVECAKLQRKKRFLMTINCVITEKSIAQAREVMDFCFENKIRFAPVPQSLADGSISGGLADNTEYQKFIKEIIEAKRRGKPVFATMEYLNKIYNFESFDCYPMIVPHIAPNGDLFYPCMQIGHVAANLLETGSYREALKKGAGKFGPCPKCGNKCFKACYIVPSSLVRSPLRAIKNYKEFT